MSEGLGMEVGPADELLNDQQRKALREALCAGIPRDLAARAAGVKNFDQVLAADQRIADLVDQCEAIGEIYLLKLTALTRPLEVLARTRPEKFGPSVARPLGEGESDDDGIDLS